MVFEWYLGDCQPGIVYIVYTLFIIYQLLYRVPKNMATFFPLQCMAGFVDLTETYKVARVGVNPLLTRNASFTKTVILALRTFLESSAS